MAIERAIVAGAGFMGHGIAQVLAMAGKRVVLYEPNPSVARAGLERIARNLDRGVAKGRLHVEERDAILGLVQPSSKLDQVASADLVVEAVFEDVGVKTQLWRAIDELAPDGCIFATNTSSISIDRLAAAVSAPRRPQFVGMHFFSPVPVMPLVELVSGTATSEQTQDAIRDLAQELGKQVIASKDRAGFIVNRMLMPYLREAMLVYEEGTATLQDVDTGARVGLNHPMGPLELADFIGLDVCAGIMRVLAEELDDPRYAPPRCLEELVAQGRLGQKSGQGFYTYPRG